MWKSTAEMRVLVTGSSCSQGNARFHARARTDWKNSLLESGFLWGIVARAVICLALGILILAVTLCDTATQSSAAAYSQPQGQEPGLRVLESSKDRVVLEVNVPDYSVSTELLQGMPYDVLSVLGWAANQEAGVPRLPVRRILLGIPPDAQVQLEVLGLAVQESGNYRIAPAPEIVLGDVPFEPPGLWLTAPHFKERLVESPAIYGIDAFYPGAVARVVEDGFIRSQRVVAIDLWPVQYNPVSRRIRSHSRFQVEVSLSYPHGRQATSRELPGSGGSEILGYEQIFRDQLLNYTSAKSWRSRSAESLDRTAVSMWPLPGQAYKIVVVRNGIHKLTYQDLASAGVPLATESIDPREIQIFVAGTEIAIQLIGEEDGKFDPEDYVLFYGQGIENKYTDRNVYWLTYGQAMGRRMPRQNGEPLGSFPTPVVFSSHLRIEQDRDHSSQWPGDDSTERWYWQRRIAYSGVPTDVIASVNLGHVSMESGVASLRIAMKANNEFVTVNPDHHAVFYVNGHPIGEHWWDGMDSVEVAELDFSQSYLAPGVNTFRTTFPGDTGAYVEYLLFDRYELSYGHAYTADGDRLEFSQTTPGPWEFEVAGFTKPDVSVYDISNPLTVTQIFSLATELSSAAYTIRFSDTVPNTRTYLALTAEHWLSPESISLDSPSGLRDPANGADYIIISHADFVPAAQRLAAYRAGQGLRTIVVDVVDVYDEFGYGLSIPHSIREFLRYAYEGWQHPAPTYVVLLGDGTYDPKNNVDQGVVSYITPYMGFVDPWMGETATENWFVTVVGEDIWPDLFVGRMPANSLAEANAMVDKTMLYEQSVGKTDWASHLVFVAGKQPDPKWAGNFHDLSNALIQDYVSPFYDVSRVYLGEIPGSTCSSGSECKHQLVDAINAGALLVNFIGHGSVIQWDGAFIFDLDTIGQLTNADRFPVMLPMTCLEGFFIHPYPDHPSLSESVVRAEGKGAVASWGPTGLGVANGHDELNRGFLDAVLLRGVREFGPATYAGKLRLYSAGHSLEQIQEYTVFGDPALRLPASPTDLQVDKLADPLNGIGPGAAVTFTLSFSNAGPGIAFDPVLTDHIPSLLVNPTVVYSSSAVLSQRAGITFSWNITDLLPHEGGQIVIRAEVAPDAKMPVTFFNRTEVASTTPDLVPWNNLAWVGIGSARTYLPLILRSQ